MAKSITALLPDDDLIQNIGRDDARFGTIFTKTLKNTLSVEVNDVARMRRPLTGPMAYTVSKDGNDNSATNFLTIARLRRELASIDGAGYGVSVTFYDGVWNEEFRIDSSIKSGMPALAIVGAGAGPTVIDGSGLNSNCISAYDVNGVTISNFKVQNGANGIYLDSAKITIASSFEFGTMSGVHMVSTNGSLLWLYYGLNYKINGSAGLHMSADRKSTIAINTVTAEIVDSPNIFIFANVGDTSSVFASDFTWTGDATNITNRYAVKENSMINTSGGGENYLPGQASHLDTASGGIYV